MTTAERIATKLYECRDAARNVLAEGYAEKMAEYGSAVQGVAVGKHCSILEAGKMLAEAAGDGMIAVLVLAATVEIIEPSDG